MSKEKWEYKTLEDAVKRDSSNISIRKVKDDNGDYPLFAAKGFVKNISFYHQEEEYLALIKDGAGIGRVSKHPAKSSIVATMQYLIPNEEYEIDFLKYFLESIDFEKYRTGSTIPHIYFKDYKSEPIPDLPLSEQQRIVALLDEAFEVIDQAKANAEKNLENVGELFESYLEDVFENKGEDWEELELGELGKVSMCKRIFKNQTNHEGEIPFYKIGTFGREPDAFISKEIYNEYRKVSSFPKKGDVLISASGTIGRRVVYDGEPAYFQDSNIVWIDNDESIILNEFLFHFYGACKWESTKGATISRLYNSNLRQIKIKFPKSFEEQQSIVSRLNALRAETNNLEAVYLQEIANLEELRKSILERAFKGEL